jgi:hypothetical protein
MTLFASGSFEMFPGARNPRCRILDLNELATNVSTSRCFTSLPTLLLGFPARFGTGDPSKNGQIYFRLIKRPNNCNCATFSSIYNNFPFNLWNNLFIPGTYRTSSE